MPLNEGGYYARSRALLTKDKGWVKPLLVLAIAAFVPILGPIGVLGYALEWARLTAWGVDAAPKQKDVQVWECVKSGWRGFLGGIGYAFAAMVVTAVIEGLLGDNVVTDILAGVVTFAGSIAFMAGALRATIYQRASAGYQWRRLLDMAKADREGLVKVAGVVVVTSLVVGIIISVVFSVVLVPFAVRLVLGLEHGGYGVYEIEYMTETMVRALFFDFLDALVGVAPWFALASYIASVGLAFVRLVTYTAMALWFRRFNVPAWGASDDPLPVMNGLPGAGYVASAPSAQAYADVVSMSQAYPTGTAQGAVPTQQAPGNAQQGMLAPQTEEVYGQPLQETQRSSYGEHEIRVIEVVPVALASVQTGSAAANVQVDDAPMQEPDHMATGSFFRATASSRLSINEAPHDEDMTSDTSEG